MKQNPGVIVIGAGGHAKVCIEILRAAGFCVDYCIGRDDSPQSCLGIPVLIGDEHLATLGRALETEVRSGRLYQRVEFAVDVNPLARIAYGLYRGRFLNAVSVGFLPLRWEEGAPGAGYRRKHLEQELIEVSAVCIPANPEALQLGLKGGAVSRGDLRELAELLRTPAAGNEFCGGGASRGNREEAQLLQLARAVRQALGGA